MCFDDDYDAFDWHQLVNGLEVCESDLRPCVLAMIIGNLRRKVKHWPYGVQVMGSPENVCNQVQLGRIRPFKPASSS